MLTTGQAQTEPENYSQRIDENLRPIFVIGVQNSLLGLQENAWDMVKTADQRAGRPDYYAGIVVLNAVINEAPKVRTGILHRNIGSRMLVMNPTNVRDSFVELGEEHRATKPEERAKLLRTYFESLRNRPERYIDPHLVIGLHKLTKHNDMTRIFRELGANKTDQLRKLTAFILAVQGHAAAKKNTAIDIREHFDTARIPKPRTAIYTSSRAGLKT